MKSLILFFLLAPMFVENSKVLANLSAENEVNEISALPTIHEGETTDGYVISTTKVVIEDNVLSSEDDQTTSSSTDTSEYSTITSSMYISTTTENIPSSSVDIETSSASTTESSTEPATESSTEPATESSTEPATESSTEPATESSTEPATESSTEPATESSTEPATESSTEPATESSTEPATESSTEPATESSTEPATESSTEPATESSTESATESSTEPATESSTEPATESSTEPATESSTEPATESSTEPATESSTESATESSAEPATESSTVTTTESSTEPTTESSTVTTTESSTVTTADSPKEPTAGRSTETTAENETPRSTTESSTKIIGNPDTTVSQTEGSTYSTDGSSTTTVLQESTTFSNDDEGGVNVGLIIGIIVTVLVIGLAAVVWRAHHTGRLSWPPKNLFSNGLTDPVRPQPVPLKKFPSHCSDMLDVPSKLSHEYQLLATLSVEIAGSESFNAALRPDNKYKNRYVNILPYDSTRVKLAPEGDNFYDDYINASYIKGYTNEIEYIATQGPKEETCRDFWRMVYQEPIKVIVMVTQLEEQGKPKCSKYFPNLRENIVLDDIIVRCTTELNFPIYTSRTLILTKGERKRSITHLHFREWPDFGCPATPDLMLQFCQVMRHNIILAQPGITLIHCSAGVGRTGTLIAVDILLQCIKDSKKIDIFGTVYKLRKHRMNMVQSEAQYVYIYKCVKEALEDPSYLSSENSSTTSLEPIYENIECVRLTPPSNKVQDAVFTENEVAL